MRISLPLLATLWLAPFLAAADNTPVVLLWPDGAPGTPPGTSETEVYASATPDRNYSQHSRIHRPSLTVYLPPKEIATGAAVIICPGGAHRFLAIDHEGYDIARWLNHIGVAGFVLKYRLAHTEGFPYTVGTSVGDALRAVRVVRSRAGEWNIDPRRVGLMGFSAGGEVAALAGAHRGAPDPAAADPVDRMSSRPDFQILVYPGGDRVRKLKVPPQAPPAFLLCAFDDNVAHTLLAQLYLKFREAGVPAELHIYARGGHGFGMRPGPLPEATWNERLKDWMADLKLLTNE
jgi:endo-1,4-beta-xylanase